MLPGLIGCGICILDLKIVLIPRMSELNLSILSVLPKWSRYEYTRENINDELSKFYGSLNHDDGFVEHH